MRAFIRFLLIAVLCLCAPSAYAHPHAWIVIQIGFVFDASGKVTAIKQRWLFDKMYTAFALHDYNPSKNGKLEQDDLIKLSEENLNGLKQYYYFTDLKQPDGKIIKMKLHQDVRTEVEHGQIVMHFTLPFVEPFDIRKNTLSYRIYDPTYYIDMQHQKNEPVYFEGNAPKNCRSDITRPSVDAALQESAAALDKNATAPDDFGGLFAQKVTVSCS